jgi:hypothetical protein
MNAGLSGSSKVEGRAKDTAKEIANRHHPGSVMRKGQKQERSYG